MVGMLVVTHRKLAEELVATTEMIVGELENCIGLSIDPHLAVDDLRGQMAEAMEQINDGDGVIIVFQLYQPATQITIS